MFSVLILTDLSKFHLQIFWLTRRKNLLPIVQSKIRIIRYFDPIRNFNRFFSYFRNLLFSSNSEPLEKIFFAYLSVVLRKKLTSSGLSPHSLKRRLEALVFHFFFVIQRFFLNCDSDQLKKNSPLHSFWFYPEKWLTSSGVSMLLLKNWTCHFFSLIEILKDRFWLFFCTSGNYFSVLALINFFCMFWLYTEKKIFPVARARN